MTLKFSEICELTEGEILHLNTDEKLDNLLIDSRQVVSPQGTIFFALSGPRFDGHEFIDQVYAAGVRYFVVGRNNDTWIKSIPDANLIKVPDPLIALQQIATHHREQYHIPVVGITGSNGKTIIKEWIYQLLSDLKVIKNPKSYNSQVGVPLSVWQLTDKAEIGIFEAGISQPGEMEKLSKIIQPTLGIFTNIGPAHDSGFTNRAEKIREKSRLFAKADKVIYRKDHIDVGRVLEEQLLSGQLFSWSTNKDVKADISFVLDPQSDGILCSWEFSGQQARLFLPFTDPASIENILHCLTLLVFLNYSSKEIELKVKDLRSISHRLSLIKGMDQCYLIDDTYNNDLAGLEVALDFLNQQPHGREKAVILSDIKQAADSPENLYSKVAQLLDSKGIHRFFGIGPDISRFNQLFSEPSQFYISTDQFLEQRPAFKEQAILIKGARDFEFEKIVDQLQEKHHGTVLEIDLGALTDNLNYFKSLLPDKTKIMVMVKAFAYGSGSQEVAHLLQYHGVDYLGVAYADEGISLRKDDIHLPIMVMNPSPDSFARMIEYQLEPEIYSLELLSSFQQFCQRHQKSASIHLKIDTGMRRLGFEASQIEELVEQMRQFPLNVSSIFSHLAAADNLLEEEFTNTQFDTFKKVCYDLAPILSAQSLRHILNSWGIINYPKFHLDMVRLGIGLYGIGPAGSKLSNISVLKTTISQIKQIQPGETIGYGRSGKADSCKTIATIAIGYADGFDRRNSNGVGKVLVRGKLAPVIGHVCMDMTMVDVTGHQAEVGDQVIIFNDKLTLSAIAANIGVIPYEILTGIGERVKRVYITR